MEYHTFLVPGIDDLGDPEAQLHTVLLTTSLAHMIADVLERSRVLVGQYRDRMLDHPDQAELDALEEELDEHSAGLSLLATMMDAEPPARYRRVEIRHR